MKPFEYYCGEDLQVSIYPNKPAKPNPDSTSKDYKKYSEDLSVYENELSEYKEVVNKRNSILSEREQEFKNDMFQESGVTENPKKDKCYQLAWYYGHSSGLREVYNYFCDLVELIK